MAKGNLRFGESPPAASNNAGPDPTIFRGAVLEDPNQPPDRQPAVFTVRNSSGANSPS